MARCYHRVCGRDFGSLSAFDRHLRLLKVPPWTACLAPESVGLHLRGGVWRFPGREGAGGYAGSGDGGNGDSSADRKAFGAS